MDSSIQHGFADFSRINLIGTATPLQRATGVERHLRREGIEVGVYLKREDLTPLGGGGNKLRKLQYLMAEILQSGHDTVVTFGGIQSNHARLTAAVCAALKVECHLVLTQEVEIDTVDYQHNGNRLLNQIFGANSHVLPRGSSKKIFADELVERLFAAGKRPAVIPTGGSTPLGAIGYAECAAEISAQASVAGLNFKRIIVPNGSSGTQAGLIAGWTASNGDPGIIHGFAVMEGAERCKVQTSDLVSSTLDFIGLGSAVPASVNVSDTQLGAAYGQPTASMREALQLLARTEGLLLDPVYSGKAFAGMLDQLRHGELAAGDDLLFVMTGGVHGLFAYQSTLGSAWDDEAGEVGDSN
ncbi:D-cysteine desulfhydrase family protein [Pseudomonas sp. ME-P-057]|uniref:D-cysteine desulfhydrase family protein n=1 Tax=Pseudomonas sp. ME-P-057 TaxID=3040321 RepID=UPI0025531153|nr:D-cysteine desulfhydrase family protein [Pseudomonas sp. ME-P-057]